MSFISKYLAVGDESASKIQRKIYNDALTEKLKLIDELKNKSIGINGRAYLKGEIAKLHDTMMRADENIHKMFFEAYMKKKETNYLTIKF